MWTYRVRTCAPWQAKENKMKAQDTHRQTGAVWKGKAGKSGEKKSPVKSRLAQFKPLSGKVFYLDLPSNKTAESLERDIKNLGGSVDKFFSKDIKYLVSNKREIKYMQSPRQDSRLPGLQSGQFSLCPDSNPPKTGCGSDDTKKRSQGQAETFGIRHRRSFVEKAAKEKDILQTNKILSKALEWGVKIFYIDDVLVYIEMKKKTVASQCPNLTAAKPAAKDASIAEFPCQKSKGRIRKPFIKVEDSSRHYCPIYATMTSMPELNLKTLAPHCPFLVDAKKPAGAKQRENSAKVLACEGQAAGRKNNDKNRGGFCECCMAKYGNLMTHLRSERHRAFSKSDAYKVLNQVVSPLDCTRFNTLMKSPSSVELDTGPFGGLNVRATENIEEKHQPHDCPKEPFTFRVSSSPQSAPLLHKKDKTCLRDSHRSKKRSILRKRPCRLNLFTSSPQKAAEETAPSCGESMAPGPLLLPHVTFDVQVPYAGTHQEPRCDSYLGSPSVVANQQEETDRSKKPPGKVGGNISERDGDHLFSQSCFPQGTVQRKVRVYERQRWKMDATRQEHVTQNGTRDKSPNALAYF
ncbi:protein DBF4 homolog A [Hippocampus zosterae]|uniref:protein DBF4 homolog A n=1 Tax=Hippocampus zosterae TaxID=109293 RepID=UPI00223D3EE8|nr:protein DBF4 homolog A [Hippocampus zosterae]